MVMLVVRASCPVRAQKAFPGSEMDLGLNDYL